jgi:hypothetical protein
MYPQIHTVIAYVPANVRYPACCGQTLAPVAWTWKGQPLSYMPLGFRRSPVMAVDAAIAVELTKGPILLISGGDDGVWQSSAMTDTVVDRLKRAHFACSFDHLKYSHAGARRRAAGHRSGLARSGKKPNFRQRSRSLEVQSPATHGPRSTPLRSRGVSAEGPEGELKEFG